MTYAQLKADIAKFLNRNDLTAVIPTFVQLAEMDIFVTGDPQMRVREMDEQATLTVTALEATLPSDFLEARSVKLQDADGTEIFYKPPNAWTNVSGFFTIIGNTLQLPEGTTSSVDLVYCAKPAALTDDTDTNAVLDAYYGAYLYSALKYGASYVKDNQREMLYAGTAKTIIDGAVKNNKARTAGSLVVRVA